MPFETTSPGRDVTLCTFSAGRLSASFGSRNTFLPIVLGPPEDWRSALSDTTAKSGALQQRAGNSSAAPAAQRLETLQLEFGCVTGQCMSHVTPFPALSLKMSSKSAAFTIPGICHFFTARLSLRTNDVTHSCSVPLRRYGNGDR